MLKSLFIIYKDILKNWKNMLVLIYKLSSTSKNVINKNKKDVEL